MRLAVAVEANAQVRRTGGGTNAANEKVAAAKLELVMQFDPNRRERILMSSPDQKILNAAIGWLELGNPVEAHNELELLPYDQRTAPEVLKLRCRVFRQAERWDCLSILADGLYTAAPQEEFLVDWAWSEFKQGRKERAALVLLHENQKFPDSEAVAYHLAIVMAALGRIPEARDWLAKALARSSDPDRLKLAALDLPEFEKMWTENSSQQ